MGSFFFASKVLRVYDCSEVQFWWRKCSCFKLAQNRICCSSEYGYIKIRFFFVCVKTLMGLESFSDTWTFCSYCFKIAQIRICCSLGNINTGITTFTTVVNTLMGVQIYRSDNFLSKSFKKSCLNIVKNRLYFCLRSLISRQQAMKE